MPRINVLEVRYAETREGPWGEPIVQPDPYKQRLRGWSAAQRNPFALRTKNEEWVQSRVVPYARVESHAGAEVPESIDEVLVGTLYGELWFFRQHAAPADETTVRLQWERKTGAGWLSSAPPDAWVELPEVPK